MPNRLFDTQNINGGEIQGHLEKKFLLPCQRYRTSEDHPNPNMVVLSAAQITAATELANVFEDGDQAAITTTVAMLTDTLIEQDLDGVSDFDSLPVHAAAVQSIDLSTFSFRKPSGFSHDLAVIIFTARFLTMRRVHAECQANPVIKTLSRYLKIHKNFLVPAKSRSIG
jgi:hypothetical protein